MPSTATIKTWCAAAGIALALISGCDSQRGSVPTLELAGSTMGTTFSIIVASPPASAQLDRVRAEIEFVLSRIELSMSTYLPSSELTAFNRYNETNWYGVSPELCEVVELALVVSAASDGAFDVTVGPVVDLWGFGPQERPSALPSVEQLRAALTRTGSGNLFADCDRPALRKALPDLRIDLSGIAKGYAVDRLAEVLAGHGFSNFLVEIGGELRASGHNSSNRDWAIAIESPDQARRAVQRIVSITDSAVASSGDYRNFFELDGQLYSHMIDPRTGHPIAHRAAAVTVIADRASMADALATALLVLGPEEGMALAERDGIAALFLVRGDAAVTEIVSRAFADRTR